MDDLTIDQKVGKQAQAINDRVLGKAISAVERAHQLGQPLDEPLWTALPEGSQVLGVTGPPGAGKSTLTDKLIHFARKEGLVVGVLAIDPSSPFTGGAILGDRIRMDAHAMDPGVFIRSMGSRTNSGGLAAATRSAVRVLADHGMDIIILETVGVGQAELDIMHVADTVAVVVVPGLGDTVQMNKAGVLEIADAFVINQADRPEARRTKMDLEQALMLGYHGDEMPTVTMTQASNGDGVEELWGRLRSHFNRQVKSGRIAERRLNGQRKEIADEATKKIVRSLGRWLDDREFLKLLESKPSAQWSVHDLATRAVHSFLEKTELLQSSFGDDPSGKSGIDMGATHQSVSRLPGHRTKKDRA